MRVAVYLLAFLVLLGLGLFLESGHRYWQRLSERERFFLGMRLITTPERMSEEEKIRLVLLRTPLWAVWRWLPDLLRHLRD